MARLIVLLPLCLFQPKGLVVRHGARRGVRAVVGVQGLPGALIQAMACSRPVVSTDCPSGPAEILGGGRFGAMVWVGDDHAMAVAIPATLDRPIARADLFNVDRAVDRYVDLMFDQGQAAFRAAPAAPVEERPG